MRKMFKKIIVDRHELILDERNVTEALKSINHNLSYYEMVVQDLSVGECGWKKTSLWYIHFTATEARWENIRNYLCELCYKIDGLKIKHRLVR